jgi:leader peptidase (prepilin peptidase)/N-methyltransferase
MGLPVVVASVVLIMVAAGALTPWLRKLAETDSAWVGSRAHVVLAGLGATGASLLATGWAELAGFAVLALACALLVVIDLAVYRLPDIIVGPMYALLIVILTITAAISGDWSRLGRAAAAGAVLALGYLILALIAPAGIGLGDVKFAAVLGTFLGWAGWSNLLVGTFAAFIVNGLVAGILLLSSRVKRSGATAFGPWMVVGAVIGIVWAPGLLAP